MKPDFLGSEGYTIWEASLRNRKKETSLAVQWLRLHTSNAGGGDWIPGQGTKIPYAMPQAKKKKKEEEETEKKCKYQTGYLYTKVNINLE